MAKIINLKNNSNENFKSSSKNALTGEFKNAMEELLFLAQNDLLTHAITIYKAKDETVGFVFFGDDQDPTTDLIKLVDRVKQELQLMAKKS